MIQDQPRPHVLSLRNGGGTTQSQSPPLSPTTTSDSDSVSSLSPPVDPLREQIISNLKGTPQPTVPGSQPQDEEFQYKRKVPTMVLYSEKGLEIYEKITNTKAYYPFEAEKEILEQYGDEIACRMFGLPSSALEKEEKREEKGRQEEEETGSASGAAKREKWGDASVGIHNYGVNGSTNKKITSNTSTTGLAVELGSGSLEKSRHLLRSMAKLLQPRRSGEKEGIMSEIEYKALDLEAASLYSTLSQLASIEGESVTTSVQDFQKTRRISVSGLHATYDEGLAFLRQQNVKNRRSSDATTATKMSPETSPSDSIRRPLPDTIEDDELLLPSSSTTSTPPTSREDGDEGESITDEDEEDVRKKTSILWLGSSIGNFTREEAVEFLKGIDLAEGDTMLIGVDGCDNGPEIVTAYNDPEGVTRDFILEGVDVAGRTLHPDAPAGEGLCSDNFEYVNRWNATLGRHEAYIRAKKALSVPIPEVAGSEHAAGTVELDEGELLAIEVSYKYTPAEAISLFHLAGLRLVQKWTDSSHRHSLYLVEKPFVFFPSHSAAKALGIEGSLPKKNPYGVPSLEEWEEMFRAWDWLLHDIIPPALRFQKPIPLRHVPLFYVGHAPAFRDIHLSRYFQEPLTEPAHFADLFERGIDPDVEDDTKIGHWHSEVPQTEKDWPKFEEIVEYEEAVRNRVRKVYEEHDGKWESSRLARVLMMVFEHEMMHFETSVYICLQACDSLNFPLGTSLPDFPSLARFDARQIEHEASLHGKDCRRQVLSFDHQTVEIGHDDDEDSDESTSFSSGREMGWDCEHPKRSVEVSAFKIDVLPITNREYLEWLEGQQSSEDKLIPASWAIEGDRRFVKTLWGQVEMEYALEWPVAASAEQLESFAKSKNGRLPSQAELSVFLSQNPTDYSLSNVGLANLHPCAPALPTLARDGSQVPASNGGLWEWTNTILSPWQGFKGSKLYPGYSSDFHDERHRIVLGGSWASPRRIARKSFVNFYQAAYPFALIGGRVAYDV